MADYADILTVEIGSTFTKVAFFTTNNGMLRFGGRLATYTTIQQNDVSLGYQYLLNQLKLQHGISHFGQTYLSSSAAGGLRIVVCGLTFNLTTKAALESALGAGGVVLGSVAGRITPSKAREIESIKPNLILLCGGLDFGEEAVILENAEVLAASKSDAIFVYAGNAAIQKQVATIFKQANKPCIVTENVYPKVDDFRFRVVQEIIRKVFETEVIKAPGVERIQQETAPPIPTPLAVSYAVEHLGQMVGDIVVLDVGGATTDVHSYIKPRNDPDTIQATLEPALKRSVEGDIGVFHNIQSLFETDSERFDLSSPTDSRLDLTKYARKACEIGLLRHCGSKARMHTGTKMVDVIYGRDLSTVAVVVGTGGAIIYGTPQAHSFQQFFANLPENGLLPRASKHFWVDRHYLLSSIGLFVKDHPQAATTLLNELLCVYADK